MSGRLVAFKLPLPHLFQPIHLATSAALPLAKRSMTTSSASASSSKTTKPIVLCGPSGVGKSTLIQRLFKEYPNDYGFSVSHTTRAPRAGEEDGKAYHFVTVPEFEGLIEKSAFLEHARFGGNYYGTSIQAVQDVSQREGKRAVLDIDAQGVKLLKANHAHLDPVYIFISPPKLSALHIRLKGRGTETPSSILKRLQMASGEMSYAREDSSKNFDVVVVNDDQDRAYEVFKRAVRQGPTDDWKGDAIPPEGKEDDVLEQAQKDADAATKP